MHTPVFSDALFEQIEEAIRQYRQKSWKDSGYISGLTVFRRMFEVAFLLSLRNEEGRPVSVWLTYVDEVRIDRIKERLSDVSALVFAPRRPCSVSELVKLAPGMDAKTATFMVVPVPGGIALAGMMQFGPKRAPLADDPFFTALVSVGVMTEGIGRVAITFGKAIVGRFEDGEFARVTLERVRGWPRIEEFRNAARAHFPKDNQENSRDCYDKCIQELAYDMAAMGHGGAVLWVPKASNRHAKQYLNIRRRIDQSSHSGVERIAETFRKRAPEEYSLTALRQFIKMIARLSCVDGAVLIDDDLRPIGYSVEIRAP